MDIRNAISDGLQRYSIGEKLRTLRLRKSMGLVELSKHTGLSAPLLSKLVIRVLLKDIYPDKLIGENLVRNSDLEWTIVQPASLTNGPLTRRYRVAEHLRHRMVATISRADLAHFLLSQLDDRTYVRRIAQLGY